MVRELSLTDWLLTRVGLPPIFVRSACNPNPPTTFEVFMANIGFPALVLMILLAVLALFYFIFQICPPRPRPHDQLFTFQFM